MAIDDNPVPIVFKEKRDSWAAELQKVIKEYNTKKLFGHG